MTRRSALALVVSFLRGHKALLAGAISWRMVYELVPMQIPVLTGAIIDALSGNPIWLYGWSPDSASTREALTWCAAGMAGVAALYGLSSYLRLTAAAHLSRKFVTHLRLRLARRVLALGLSDHASMGSSELLVRILNDTQRVRRLIGRVFIQAVTGFLRAGYPIAMVLILDPGLALVALSVLPVQWIATQSLQKRLQAAVRSRRNQNPILTEAVKETLDCIEDLKGCHAEPAASRRIEKEAEKLERRELRTSRLAAAISGAVWAGTSFGLALTWWQGSLRVEQGAMTTGELVVFAGFVTFAYRPLRQFSNILKTYRQGLVSLERIQEIFDKPTEAEQRSSGEASLERGRIRMEDVHFSYDEDRPVLRGVTLEIAPNALTAITGESGSGKSSLLRLLVGLYRHGRGSITVDGRTLDEIGLESLRRQVVIVPQTPLLFSASIAENVALGRPEADRLEIEEACRKAGAWRFVEALAEGLDTRIGREGTGLSGGERQRIAIARALLLRPSVLILDEPTSALDRISAKRLIRTLRRLSQTMTVVMASHGLEAAAAADSVIHLEDGRVSDSAAGSASAAESNLTLPPEARS